MSPRSKKSPEITYDHNKSNEIKLQIENFKEVLRLGIENAAYFKEGNIDNLNENNKNANSKHYSYDSFISTNSEFIKEKEKVDKFLILSKLSDCANDIANSFKKIKTNTKKHFSYINVNSNQINNDDYIESSSNRRQNVYKNLLNICTENLTQIINVISSPKKSTKNNSKINKDDNNKSNSFAELTKNINVSLNVNINGFNINHINNNNINTSPTNNNNKKEPKISRGTRKDPLLASKIKKMNSKKSKFNPDSKKNENSFDYEECSSDYFEEKTQIVPIPNSSITAVNKPSGETLDQNFEFENIEIEEKPKYKKRMSKDTLTHNEFQEMIRTVQHRLYSVRVPTIKELYDHVK